MLTKRRRTTPERLGEPSRKQKRAANNLAIRQTCNILQYAGTNY